MRNGRTYDADVEERIVQPEGVLCPIADPDASGRDDGRGPKKEIPGDDGDGAMVVCGVDAERSVCARHDRR